MTVGSDLTEAQWLRLHCEIWEAFVGGKPLQKYFKRDKRKVLCAQKFLLLKTRTICVPVSQDKYDQTTRVLVKHRAVRSLWEGVWYADGAVGLSRGSRNAAV